MGAADVRWLAGGSRTPIAWLSLIHRKSRLAASVSGVAFAAVLMFLEMGFRYGLFDSQTYAIRMLNADLVILHQQKEALVPQLPFPRRRLVQALSVPGVVAAYPLYVEEYRSLWKNSTDGHEYPMLVYGFDPDDPVFLIPEVLRLSAALKEPDTAIVDSQSRNFYGELAVGRPAELSRRAVRIVGTYELGPDFRVDGDAIVSDRTFVNAFGNPADPTERRTLVEFGLLKVRPGEDVAAVQRAVIGVLPTDVRVLTKRELVELVEQYWNASKPVGAVFGLGMFVGFLIGVAICYQILYTDILDNLPQYATLKAIGYQNRAVVTLVLRKALYLGALGFVPGMFVSLGLYSALHAYSGIRMDLTPGRTFIVLLTTLGMCLVSAAIAIRKVVQTDPAEVF
jgi:putative ABC transport system permease protein